MSNMKTENENDLFEIEFYDGDIKNELPISLFEEIEAELCVIAGYSMIAAPKEMMRLTVPLNSLKI